MSVVSLEEDVFLYSQDRARLTLASTSCFVRVSGSWGADWESTLEHLFSHMVASLSCSYFWTLLSSICIEW